MEFASRLDGVADSATLRYSALAKKPGVINLTIGRPDFDTPKVVKEAAKKALDDGRVHYIPARGIPELCEKIAQKLQVENGIKNLDKDRVIVSVGAKQILFELFFALVDKNDVVTLPNPSWVSYEPMVQMCDGKIDWLPLKAENGFIPDETFLSKLENSKAKILAINSPNNPTGAVYPEKILVKIVDICAKKGITLISDECYEKIIYEGKHFSPASIYEKTVTVSAFSKEFSMTGWRLGYAACSDKEVIEKMNLIQEQSVSSATSFAEYGALACFTPEAAEMTKRMVAEFRKRRDYSMERLQKMGILCVKPSGAFYVFPKFGGDDFKLADKLLQNGVGVVPGSPFGSNGKGCVRISYGSANLENLKTGFDRIEKTISG